ncbi:MAG: guanitoxin biosynthesis heme-dependent pre-guanitoxin N-hydroxylase GntA [Ginsengibacter sp.]
MNHFMNENEVIIQSYFEYLNNKSFPCVAAKAALSREQIKCFVASNLMCPADDMAILNFIYDFVDTYRGSKELYHSAAVIFKGPVEINEDVFETLMWQRLQSLADLDMARYPYDNRVNKSPESKDFSFSLKQEAFFIIGLHPASARETRKFSHPALVFNPHSQFQKLKETSKYSHLQSVVRKRDIAFSGSINPMLEDFGNASEVFQYSGKIYDNKWKCPLRINHRDEHNTAA